MATQGLVSVLHEGRVVAKAVAGCNGYNACILAESVRKLECRDAASIAALAKDAQFGCADCLVVMDRHGVVISECDDELGPLYRDKFDDPAFNPRWACGLASHVEQVCLPALAAAQQEQHDHDR